MQFGDRELSFRIGEVGSAVDRAACDASRWVDVASLVHQLVPGTKVIMQIVDMQRAALLPPIVDGFLESTISAYEHHFWKLNPYYKPMAEMKLSSFKRTVELCPDENVKKTSFYNDLVKPEGEADGATVLKFASHRGRHATIALHYDNRIGERTDEQMRSLLHPLIPRMRAALEVNHLASRVLELPGGRGLIDNLIDAAMILDEDCRLLAANFGASALLADAGFMLIGARDFIQIKNAEATRAFAGVVKITCSPFMTAVRQEDIQVTSARTAYTITCVPIALDQAGISPLGLASIYAPKTVCLVIIRPCVATDDPEWIAANISLTFGLTKAQTTLLLEFERGGTLSQIAERLGVSRSTAHTHLKAIFSKTGTSKQRDIVTMVMKLKSSRNSFTVM
ncbi:helix-turn-helix transcriptional regulator [Phyllobacterium myrsinacearum]|uniref:DNA-binding CsgD family transcriptional regulator n=1 Tax=Phyllobacterium myrsinacearum TaxID=28101 RepID=A0A839EM18_9HYPH|nr:helix-turn-helix transcriptional regulator [Phyllobacterium myrsinacearum]MBA8881091.1 DNA-binding CsgD family transcriptional regulator [Phyllobacterium myrsinacearum]